MKAAILCVCSDLYIFFMLIFYHAVAQKVQINTKHFNTLKCERCILHETVSGEMIDAACVAAGEGGT